MPEKIEKKKTIGFRGSEEYRAALAQAALTRKLKVQSLLERAVVAYLCATGDGIVAPALLEPVGKLLHIQGKISDVHDELLTYTRFVTMAMEKSHELAEILSELERVTRQENPIGVPGTTEESQPPVDVIEGFIDSATQGDSDLAREAAELEKDARESSKKT